MNIRNILPRVCTALLAMLAAAAVACAEEGAAPQAPPAAAITLHYLTKEYEEPIPLSLVDKILADNGLQGARLGIAENNKSGRFVNQEHALTEHVLAPDGDAATAAKDILAAGPAIIVADLEPDDLLAVADLPEAKDAIIFNVRLSDDALRAEKCRANVFHIAPSYAMKADALAQYLIWKKWTKWFLLTGTAPSGKAYAAMVKRAATRFGGKIVEERVYEFDPANPRTDSGHQQIQTQMPQVTQGASGHDVVWIADTTERFGEYVPYRVHEPRPVVGTQGLMAAAWHRCYEQYAGMQMQSRFERAAGRVMTERDFSAWLAARAIGEAALRLNKTDVPALRAYILSPDFAVAGFKGEGLSFRTWDHQLRQPMLITGARSLVSMSPQDGFLHEKNLNDTLGYDRPENQMPLSRHGGVLRLCAPRRDTFWETPGGRDGQPSKVIRCPRMLLGKAIRECLASVFPGLPLLFPPFQPALVLARIPYMDLETVDFS